LTNFLSQMPADRVAKVEVMPNPSARNDPEGTGGIVNIIMKDNVDLGLSGNLSANGSTRGSRGFNGRLAYQKGRLTFFGGGSLSFSDNRNDLLDERQNLLASPITIMRQEGETVNGGTFDFFDLTTEYKLSKKTTAWLTAMRYGGGFTNDASILYGLFDTGYALLDQYDRITDGTSDYSTSDYAIGLKHQFVPQRHELTIDLRRSGYGSAGATFVDKMAHEDVADPSLLEHSITDMDSDNRNLTLRADYTRPWGQKGRIETGINLSRREMDDNRLQDVFVAGVALPEAHYASLYDYNENYRSAYLTLGQSFGRLGVQVGVRAELAQTDFTLHSTGEHFDNDYNSVFPNVIVSVDAGKQQTIRLSYSKRIGRPSSSLLNPYTPSSDPLNRQIGNPYLEPSFTHSLSIDYTRNSSKGTLRIAPFYRRSVNGWESIKRVDENGVSTVTYENSRSSEMMGTSVTASIRPVGRLSGSLSGNVYRQVTDATNISAEYSRDGVNWSISGNLAARITPTLNAQMFGSYMPAREIPQGRMSGYAFTSVGLRQQLIRNKATLSLSLNDPFRLYHYTFETRDHSHIQTSRTNTNFRQASLSLTWNFGKPPQQNSRRNGPETSDESVRIR
jgi:Outer membrane protein beta-barrel family